MVYYFDRDGKWPPLGAKLLRALQMNEPNELIPWAQSATKPEIASLAMHVFAAWHDGDKIARDILNGAAASLAKDGIACARRLANIRAKVQFVFSGSVLLKQPKFAAKVAALLRKGWKNAVVTPLTREGAWGAVELARIKRASRGHYRSAVAAKPADDLKGLTASPTEARNKRSMRLDTMSVRNAIELMLDEDRAIPRALARHTSEIERVVEMIARSLSARRSPFLRWRGHKRPPGCA